jgi:hypothetical protein
MLTNLTLLDFFEAIIMGNRLSDQSAKNEASIELSEEDLASVAGGTRKIGGKVWGGAASWKTKVKPSKKLKVKQQQTR